MHFLFGAIGGVAVLVLRFISTTTITIGKYLAYGLGVVPSFPFCTGIINMCNKQLFAAIENYSPIKNTFDWDISLTSLVYLGGAGIFYFVLLLILENLLHTGNFTSFFTNEKSNQYKNKIKDEDVMKEE